MSRPLILIVALQFVFRGKRSDLVKLLRYDGQGLCLFSKRMDRGRFVWPVTRTGKLHTDDTPVPILVPGKGKTAQARLWAYVVDGRASGATSPALA